MFYFLPIIAKIVLTLFCSDPYQVVMQEKSIFTDYEIFFPLLLQAPTQELSRESNLYAAKASYKIGNIYRRLATKNDLKKALVYHQSALKIRKSYLDKNNVTIAESYLALGATYNESKGKENNKQALGLYKKAISIYKFHGSATQKELASAFNNTANALRDLDKSNIPLALDYQNRALIIFAQFPDDSSAQKDRAKILYNQGVNFHILGEKENNHRAIESLNQAKDFFYTTNDHARLAITLSYLGKVYTDMGSEYFTKAYDHLKQALEIQQTIYTGTHSETTETLERLKVLENTARTDEVCQLRPPLLIFG